MTNDSQFPASLAPVSDPDGVPDNQASSLIISNFHVVSVGAMARSNFDLSIDFGYRYAGNNALSGTVGLDTPPYDGVLGVSTTGVSAGEAPFSGVPVFVYRWNDANSNAVMDGGEVITLGSVTTGVNGDYLFTGLASSGGVGTNYYVVSMTAPQANLKLTTTNGVTPALWISESTNLAGETLAAYQVVPVAGNTSNVDFAFKSTLLLDFGDLPSSYSTLLTDVPDGPRHVVATPPALYLGSGVSTELNGIPSVDASGDSYDDGVTTSGPWSVGTNGAVVSVQVGKGAGWLVGYVDFGQKGSFLGAHDVVISQAVATNGGNGSGLYSFPVNVPDNGISASTTTVLYARFRLFSSQPLIPGVAFSGVADNGEVEDYRWVFGSVGTTIWYDANTNGIKEAGESGLTNVTVFVDLNDNGIRDAAEPSARTDVNGAYGIGGLPAGTYRIRVDASTLPGSLSPSFDADGGKDNCAIITVTAGEVKTNVNFGYSAIAVAPPALVPGFAFAKTLISPANRPCTVGEEQVFCLVVTNTGEVVLDAVSVTDEFNTNRDRFVSAIPAPTTTNAPHLVWSNLGSLALGDQIAVTARFVAVASGVGSNVAWVTPSTNGMSLSAVTNSAVYTNINPAFAVTKTVIFPVGRSAVTNGPAMFMMTVSNSGDVALGSIRMSDIYDPAVLQFDSAVVAPNSAVAGTLVWNNLGTLAVGASLAVTGNFTALTSTMGGRTTNTMVGTASFEGIPGLTNSLTNAATLEVTIPVGLPVTFTNTPDTSNVTFEVTTVSGAVYQVISISNNIDHPSQDWRHMVTWSNMPTWVTYKDSNVVQEVSNTRFYQIVWEEAGVVHTNPVMYEAFVQKLVTGYWHELSMPVECYDYHLNGVLGSKVAVGLNGDAANGDLLYALKTNGNWETYMLNASRKWVIKGGDGSETTDVISPSSGYWVKRQIGGVSTNIEYAGPVRLTAEPVTFAPRTWQLISWPFPRSRTEGYHSNGWGFATAGAHGDNNWELADRLYVGNGTNTIQLYLKPDGRWYKVGLNTSAADVRLQHGVGYYYYHNGTGFTWTAESPIPGTWY